MLKPKAKLLRATIAAGLTVTALVGLGWTGSASAMRFDGGPSSGVTLSGGWAPFTRCPVDDPTMLSVDGIVNQSLCLVVSAPSGSITIGKFTAPLGAINAQAGLILNRSEGTETLVSPQGGFLVGSPLQLPGGLQALVCPSSSRALREICQGHHDRFLNSVVVTTLSSAGDPSNFVLSAGFEPGVPIVTLPLKLHLESPLLGEHCYIGTNMEPIVAHPETVTPATLGFGEFGANGMPEPNGPIIGLSLTGSALNDKLVAIPSAHGCGFAGLLDQAIDKNVGLPSPSGSNDLALNEVSSVLAGLLVPEEVAPNAGQVLSSDWHAVAQHGHH